MEDMQKERKQNVKNKKLRIAVLGHKRIPSREGGIEIVVEELSVRMAKLGHQVTIYAKDIFFVGRGIDYAICMEGSLKMKEISYIHSEAYAAGELKHGTISLIED